MEGFPNLIGHLEGVPQPPCRGLTITMIINHLQVLGWSSKYLIFRLFWGRVGFPSYKPYPWSPYIGEYWVPSLKLTARTEKIPFWEKIMFNPSFSGAMFEGAYVYQWIVKNTLEVEPLFFKCCLTNHYSSSKGSLSSKRNHHFWNGGWLPGNISKIIAVALFGL